MYYLIFKFLLGKAIRSIFQNWYCTYGKFSFMPD